MLGRGVLFYSRLGLEFEGGEVGEDGSMKCLRLVFRQVRPRCNCFTTSSRDVVCRRCFCVAAAAYYCSSGTWVERFALVK